MEKSSDNLNIENNTFANCGKKSHYMRLKQLSALIQLNKTINLRRKKMIDLFRKEEYNEEYIMHRSKGNPIITATNV